MTFGKNYIGVIRHNKYITAFRSSEKWTGESCYLYISFCLESGKNGEVVVVLLLVIFIYEYHPHSAQQSLWLQSTFSSTIILAAIRIHLSNHSGCNPHSAQQSFWLQSTFSSAITLAAIHIQLSNHSGCNPLEFRVVEPYHRYISESMAPYTKSCKESWQNPIDNLLSCINLLEIKIELIIGSSLEDDHRYRHNH